MSSFNSKDLLKQCPNKKISEALDYLYHSERKATERISFVKENYTYLFTPFILANWPDVKFVYQVRDPRDVIASWLKTASMPGGVAQAVQTWKQDQVETLKVLNQVQTSNRSILIRYEDLIENSETISRNLCKFLDLEYDDRMLEFHMNKLTQENAQRIDAWNNLDKPIIKNNSGKYIDSLSQYDIRYIELTCFSEMQLFGYALDTDVSSLSSSQIENELIQLKEKLALGNTIILKSKNEQSVRSKRLNIIEKVKSRKAMK